MAETIFDAVSGTLNNNTAQIVTNANGTAYKFNSGLMICTKKVTGTVACTSTYGQLYESGDVNLGNWAVEFVSEPNIYLSQKGDVGWFERIKEPSTTFVGKTVFCRPTSISSLSYTISVTGIGQWK